MLLLQWVIVFFLCGIFYLFKTFNTAYWLLSDLTGQLALIFYVLLFAAAIHLRKKTPKNPNAFRIPGGDLGIWIVGIVGLLTCLTAVVFGFIPPKNIQIENIALYETILALGLVLFIAVPFFIYRWARKAKD